MRGGSLCIYASLDVSAGYYSAVFSPERAVAAHLYAIRSGNPAQSEISGRRVPTGVIKQFPLHRYLLSTTIYGFSVVPSQLYTCSMKFPNT